MVEVPLKFAIPCLQKQSHQYRKGQSRAGMAGHCYFRSGGTALGLLGGRSVQYLTVRPVQHFNRPGRRNIVMGKDQANWNTVMEGTPLRGRERGREAEREMIV